MSGHRTRSCSPGRAGLTAVAVTLVLGPSTGGCCPPPVHAREPEWVVIFGDEEWYKARSEQEQPFRGRLRPREVTSGPGSRTALRYALVTDDSTLPVYAPDENDRLRRFVERRVVARGKRVDLASEGFGVELWIARIAAEK